MQAFSSIVEQERVLDELRLEQEAQVQEAETREAGERQVQVLQRGGPEDPRPDPGDAGPGAAELQPARQRLDKLRRSSLGQLALLEEHTHYNKTQTELLLFQRIKIRRQKRLSWNMIEQRESYTRRVIQAAHEIFKRNLDVSAYKIIERDGPRHQQRLKKGEPPLQNKDLYEIALQQSNRELHALMKEAIKKLQKFKTSSQRFEGFISIGDIVPGWLDHDTKNRPKLRVKY